MLIKKYFWKELTNDGLLKEPKLFGPYHSEESLNNFDGHDTEAEAFEKLFLINRYYPYEQLSNLTLIAVYDMDDE